MVGTIVSSWTVIDIIMPDLCQRIFLILYIYIIYIALQSMIIIYIKTFNCPNSFPRNEFAYEVIYTHYARKKELARAACHELCTL